MNIINPVLARIVFLLALTASAVEVQAQVDVRLELTYPRLEASAGAGGFGEASSRLGPAASLEELRITEIMYNPSGGGAEFLELLNTGSISLDISGVYFSDGIVFTFAASTTINAGEYLVLVRDTDQTAFGGLYAVPVDGVYTGALSNGGERVAMSAPGGTEFLSLTYDDSAAWPSLADGQGWSLVIVDPQGNGSDPNNWAASGDVGGSPRAPETNPATIAVADTEFSVDRGFYDEAFTLELSTDTEGATIRYTLDGSTPTCNFGSVYSGPIQIGGTSIVRAIACKTGWLPTNVDTQTYIFTGDIVTQSPSGEPPGPGWPAGMVNDQVFDYAMDPNVVNDPRYANLIDDALLSIPSISIVTDLDNLLDPATGIYVNAIKDGKAWERPTSVELINPDGSEGFQIDAGLRIRGGSSRIGSNPKHAFRLFFRDEYGAGKLKFRLFGDEGAGEFDKFDLRTSSQYSWSLLQGQPPNFWQVGHLATLNRDVFNRDTQRDMGQPYTRSRYYHLYLNGVYWGLYQSQERGEARFAETYFGGDKTDYDTVKVDSGIGRPYTVTTTDGTIDAWYRLWDQANAGLGSDEAYYRVQGLNPDGTPNAAYERLLDVENLIDYMVLIFYGGNLDSPITWFGSNNFPNNFFVLYNRNAPDGFKSLMHDAEHTMLLGNILGQGNELFRDRTGPFPAGDLRQYSNPQWMHQQLVAHPEYRMQFADHAHRHFFNGGTLTPGAAEARFMTRADEIELAIIGESARWGDSTILPARTKDDDWLPAVNDVRNIYFPNRTGIVLGQLRNKGWYPNLNAPVFFMNGVYQHGGYASAPYALSMTNPGGSGTVYFTLDGSDPRQPGTSSGQGGSLIVTESATKRVLVPTGAGDLDQGGTFWTDVGFDDSTWISGSGGVGYEVGSGYEAHFDIDVEAGMYNGNGTACIRVPFTLTAGELADIGCMTLRLKYDDGFIAYLNGSEVARANAPAAPAWNSLATGIHDDSAAVLLAGFNIDVHVGELVVGANVLAIQGLNVATNSSDFLISAQLEAFDCSQPSVAAGAIVYGGPFALAETTHVKARVEDGGEWSALNEATFVLSDFTDDLRVTEIMYHPPNPEAEYIELKNVGAGIINLVNTSFTKGIHFTFPDMILAPGAYLLVVKDSTVFDSVYGAGLPVAGEYVGRLDNGGERVRLEDPTGATILDFRYEDSWYRITDGDGFSLTIRDPASADTGLWGRKEGWRASGLVGGSPGTDDSGLIPDPGSIVIHEVLAHSHAGTPDWIELHNTTGAGVNIGGWFLSENNLDLMKYKIAAGTSIAAGAHIVLYEDQHFGNPGDPGTSTAFSLSENGETVYLSSGLGGALTGYREQEDFGASDSNVAFGRHLKSTGTFNFVAMSSNTPTASNAYPKVGPVVINEIMYHPATDSEEYIELYNITGSAVGLYDDEGNPWVFSKGIVFTFPPGTTIPANGYLLVAKDPVAFATRYFSPPSVAVLGPYTGVLSNNGEKLEIAMPGDVNAKGKRQYIRIDRVNYDDKTPWPTGPDGSGTSLQRKVTTDYGNDVANWEESSPTPGGSIPGPFSSAADWRLYK